jgi:hypothetical protein
MARSSVSYAIAALALGGALGLAWSCKSTTSNNCGNGGTPPNLVGNYTLLSYTIGPSTIPAPPASGSLRFHVSTYGVDLSIPTGTGNQVIADSGTYSIVGSSCIQELSVLGNPQFSGSFELHADSTFHVSGTAGGQVAASVWKKM